MSSAATGTDLALAADLICDGEVVGMPTETVYGLAANAFDEAAVLRVFEVKRRPSFDPLIVHLASAAGLGDVARLDALTPAVRAQVDRLTERFWPGPLTLVLPKVADLPDLVTSGLDTVAVRVPDHEMARALIVVSGVPLAAPSANPFGYISPTTAAHVLAQLGDDVPYVLDGGECGVGVESTIVAPPLPGVSDAWTVLRDGGLPREVLADVLGAPLRDGTLSGDEQRPAAPGQLASHYAPRTPLRLGALSSLLDETLRDRPDARVHLLAFRDVPAALRRDAGGSTGARDAAGATAARGAGASEATRDGGSAEVARALREGRVTLECLSRDGDLRGAARALFAALRRADVLGADLILAESVPDEGLGRAINDRLRRASAPASHP